MQPLTAVGAKPGALEPTRGLAGGKAWGPPRSKFKLEQGPPQCPQLQGKMSAGARVAAGTRAVPISSLVGQPWSFDLPAPASSGSLYEAHRPIPMDTTAPQGHNTVPIPEMRRRGSERSAVRVRPELSDLGALCCLSLMPQGFPGLAKATLPWIKGHVS